ncbi:MAG: Mov34/MPN/PAD-1 family protein [Candidatus Binatia bacterium]
MEVRLSAASVAAIDREAVAAYPEESCGIVLADGDAELVRPVPNIQNRLHAEDPAKHPRDARIAYFMEPKALFAVLEESDKQKRPIRVFYHSHPEHDAYFSNEDRERALAWDEPAYPDAVYLVVSVYGGAIKDRRAYAWDEARRDFAEVALEIGE